MSADLDQVITILADSEARLRADLAALRAAYDSLEHLADIRREAVQVAASMLARVTYERDVARARLYQRAGVPVPSDAVPTDAMRDDAAGAAA